jgi:hypothetical protein
MIFKANNINTTEEPMYGIALHFPAILGIKTTGHKTLLSAHNLSQCFVTFDYVVQGGGGGCGK